MPNSHAKTERGSKVLSEDGNLLDAIFDTANAGTADGEESHIGWAKSSFFAILGGNEDITSDDESCLVIAEMPIGASSRAFPNHNPRSAVVACRQCLVSRLGRASQNPASCVQVQLRHRPQSRRILTLLPQIRLVKCLFPWAAYRCQRGKIAILGYRRPLCHSLFRSIFA